ncbi:prepilin-type N-terminal cleavage/methylation domain-containing protein [Tateyamaria omphalii]|uniref:prepilin-type N-terminal cleavage/methylation domain-containing protein n=1 Tax=Tateyamaria omphalii TaxID=299262 RepID=UPI001671F283|nr:prepilin-type N-terminal cleavage/methylation domain-containing protein [Tateyamaria omphalii]
MTRARSGFTLLELLISLLLLAMISAAVASVTGYAVRLFDRSDDLQRQSEQLHHRALLRDWIVRADPDALSRFAGTADELTFQARSDTALAWNTGHLIIQVASGEDGTDLRLLDDENASRETLPLSSSNLQLSYYGMQAGQAGWHDSWIEQGALPILIRISGSDAREWPDFIAMPRLSAD